MRVTQPIVWELGLEILAVPALEQLPLSCAQTVEPRSFQFMSTHGLSNDGPSHGLFQVEKVQHPQIG